MLKVKKRQDIVIMVGTKSGKSLLFQILSFIIKDTIILVIISILVLMND